MSTHLHAYRTGKVVVLLATGLVEAEPHLDLLLVVCAAVGVSEARLCDLRGLAGAQVEIELLLLEAARPVGLQRRRPHQGLLNFVEWEFSEVHVWIVGVDGAASKGTRVKTVKTVKIRE